MVDDFKNLMEIYDRDHIPLEVLLEMNLKSMDEVIKTMFARDLDKELRELMESCDTPTLEEMLATFEANERDELASPQNGEKLKSNPQNEVSGKSRGSSHFRIRI